ncbi:hypothetical protein ACIQXZ_12540 [Bacillus thuringiensis]|uniref:hypothetical protein n=1 Tax=Bacillus thuringiensis TaxID=1428 RepID=UPI0037F7D70D
MNYLTEFLTVVNTLILGAFCTTYFKTKGKNRADKEDVEEISMFKEKGKNLATKQDIKEITGLQEQIKQEFQLKMEQHKTELSKLSKEFELYTAKKHEYYPELYKNIALCISKVQALRGFRRVIDFRRLNEGDIVKYMEDKSFNESDKQLVLSDLSSDKELAIKNLELVLLRIEYTEAENSYIAANNFYLLQRLYFSPRVSSITEDILSEIYKLWINYDPDFMHINNPGFQKQLSHDIKGFKENIETLHDALFKELQGELIKK